MNLHEFIHEVLIHGVKDTALIIPVLFITYLIIELFEHKSSKRVEQFIQKSGIFGSILGGIIGVVPQCGMSVVASNLFSGGVITVGTLLAVFLSTSDEMLPILVSSSVPMETTIFILVYKTVVSIVLGLIIDVIYTVLMKHKPCGSITNLCSEENCDCEEKGIINSAIHHTLTVGAFLLVTTLVMNACIYLVGDYNIAKIVYTYPILSYFASSLVGLIPSCASSVILTSLFVEGLISVGTMLSGIFTSTGVGLLVLIRTQHCKKETLFIILSLVLSGNIFGYLIDILIKFI